MRLLGWGIAAGVGLVAIALGLLAVLGMPTYEVPKVDLELEITPQKVARGKRLVSMVCHRCHFDAGTGRLSGRALDEVVTGLGTLRAPNITRDPEHGIGTWSAGQLALLLRTGLHPLRGTEVPTLVMPRWPRMADDDLEAIIAFLRSDDPWVSPLAGGPEPTKYSLRARVRALVSWSPLPYPRKPIAGPSPEELEAYGGYLVDDVLQCASCHSGDGTLADTPQRRESEEYLSGGAVTNDINGVVLRAANLTPHATGLRGWTSDQLRRALVDGFGPDERVVRWPMPRYPGMESHEVEAIHAYLQTVAPVSNEIEASPPYRMVGRKADPGRHLYLSYGCHYCHGEAGQGLADLGGAAERFATDDEIAAYLRDPRREDPFVTMPPWDGVIADEDYAELSAHVRALERAE